MNNVFPVLQFFKNGNPVSGGTVYTYAPGTSTPKATYPTKADLQAGTNANASTLTLDSNGMIQGGVALWMKGAYKIDVKDSGGVSLTGFPIDNVNDPEMIRAASGEPIVQHVGVANAVNYMTITNSTTGNPIILGPAGSDTDISITIQGKGAGVITWSSPTTFSQATTFTNTVTYSSTVTYNGTVVSPMTLAGNNTTGSGGFTLNEKPANGSNQYTLKAPDTFGTGIKFVLPATNGTSTNVLTTDGSGNTSWAATSASTLGTSGALVILSGTQTIAASTTAKITWNSKVYDIASEFSTVNNRFTATSTGTYLVSINVTGLNSGAFGHTDTCFLYKNGSPTGYAVTNFFTGIANQQIPFTFTLPIQLNATDFLEVFYQNATGSTTVVIQTVSTFAITRLY